jgi:hypothetical protein
MVSFRIRLPAEQAAVVLKAIEAAKASLEDHDRDDDVSAETPPSPWDDPPAHPDEDVSAETRHARRADALVRVAESFLEPDGRPRSLAEKYQVHVHLDLRRAADGPVADPDAPALAEETIRRLGCEAGLVPVLHDGEEILSVGRKTRAVPPAIRRALRLRDRGCRFPGCTHTRHVDAHHVRHWADGGETKLSNLVELCGGHHRLLHEGGYGLRVTDDGALVFTRPDGERIPDVPRPLVLTGDPVAVARRGQSSPRRLRGDVSLPVGWRAAGLQHHGATAGQERQAGCVKRGLIASPRIRERDPALFEIAGVARRQPGLRGLHDRRDHHIDCVRMEPFAFPRR